MKRFRPAGVSFRLFSILFVVLAAAVASAPAFAACGDGVVDAGEDCDDGTQNGSANSCCSTSCFFNGHSPDVVVGDLTTPTRYGTVNGITGYAIGTTSCNLGSCWLNWIQNTAEHPVIGQNMFRLKDGRFEQVGQAWLKHGYTALQGTVCSASCTAAPNGAHLGVNCSDPYSSSLNGTQTRLGPKQDVNPYTGVFLYPDARINLTGDAIYKRLQVHNTDLDSTQNPGALYFVEGQYVTHDDAQAKANANNASYRPVTVGAAPNYTLTLTGSTQRQKAGIQAWKATDASVTEVNVAAPEGLFILSAKATALGGGVYHYEYALQNLTNQRAGQSFTVPFPIGATITNVGFHDVDYHSGEPFDGTDWTPTVSANTVTWATQTYAVNQNANALRWGTLYNFRFDANVAPGTGTITIGLFRPGTPSTVTATNVVPGPCAGAPNGTGCSDFNACTLTDSCVSGVCVGSNPVVCAPGDACHDAGVCNAQTGACSNAAKPDGFACDDADPCTQTDTCQSGACTGANPVVCTAMDSCHDAGTCDSLTGFCSHPVKPDGSPCVGSDLCQVGATCGGGVCSGGTAVVCSAQDACHDAGTCDAFTGLCSNPAKPDGFGCDDANACTIDDACLNGVCTGIGPVLPKDVGNSVAVDEADGVATISWTVAADSSASSVLRGLVSQLPVGPGGGDETCLAPGVAGTSTTDADLPPADEAYWYLVRGTNACGTGPYGFESQNEIETLPRVTATCP